MAYKLARTTPGALWLRYPPATRLCAFVVHNQGLRPIQGGKAGGGVHACAGGKCVRWVVDMQSRGRYRGSRSKVHCAQFGGDCQICAGDPCRHRLKNHDVEHIFGRIACGQ